MSEFGRNRADVANRLAGSLAQAVELEQQLHVAVDGGEARLRMIAVLRAHLVNQEFEAHLKYGLLRVKCDACRHEKMVERRWCAIRRPGPDKACPVGHASLVATAGPGQRSFRQSHGRRRCGRRESGENRRAAHTRSAPSVLNQTVTD